MAFLARIASILLFWAIAVPSNAEFGRSLIEIFPADFDKTRGNLSEESLKKLARSYEVRKFETGVTVKSSLTAADRSGDRRFLTIAKRSPSDAHPNFILEAALDKEGTGYVVYTDVEADAISSRTHCASGAMEKPGALFCLTATPFLCRERARADAAIKSRRLSIPQSERLTSNARIAVEEYAGLNDYLRSKPYMDLIKSNIETLSGKPEFRSYLTGLQPNRHMPEILPADPTILQLVPGVTARGHDLSWIRLGDQCKAMATAKEIAGLDGTRLPAHQTTEEHDRNTGPEQAPKSQ